MGRTSTARDRLVDVACDLVHTRGYTALGVAEICAAADVRKGSFYHFFESKQSLAVVVVQHAWARQRLRWQEALADDVPPLARLARLLDLQAADQQAEQSATGHMRGCLFGNLAQEMSQDPAIATQLAAVFDDQVDLVAGVLAAAAEQGALDPGRATRETARAVLAQLEGMVLFAKLAGDPSLLARLWPHTAMLLGVDVRVGQAA